MKSKSKSSKTKRGNVCTMSSLTSTVQLELPLLAIAESPVLNNEMILTDKLPLCPVATHKPTKSSETLAVETRHGASLHTSDAKGLKPYWTDYCKALSSQLLLPTGTDCADLDLNSYSTWLSATVDKSWFSTNLFTVPNLNSQPTCSRSFTSSLAECTDTSTEISASSEVTLRKSKRIKLCLTIEQKKTIKHWLGVSRFVYNKTIDYLQQPDTKANWLSIKKGMLDSLPEWAKIVPFQIKSIAIKDACNAVKNAKAKYKKTGEIQKVKFRSRKDIQQSCYIPKSAISSKGIYQTILGQIHYTETLPDNLGDSRLVFRNGQYYLSVSLVVPRTKAENQGRIVALDPGVRSFLTLFSPDSFGWIGNQDIGKIQRLCHYLDDLISRSTKVKAKVRQRYRKACNKLRLKIRNLIDELHQKVAKFLVDNYDVILLPTFEVSGMVLKAGRKIKSKTVRQMLTWSHYRFKQFLKHKAFEMGKTVIDCCEAYTSKTVSWTGEIIDNLGGAKVIKSKIDGQKMDRDLNGARGIFLRALVDTPSLKDSLSVHC